MADDTLEKALAELKANLKQPIPILAVQNKDAMQEDIREQARIVLEIVEAELKALSNDNQNPEEKYKQLSTLYKSALRNHYIAIVTTLNAALKETNPEQQRNHAEKLKKLADISKPALKAALYALAGLVVYITALVTAAQVSPLIALAPATYGGSLVATVPVSIVASKMKKKGDDFFSESEKHSNDAWAIKDIQEKIENSKLKKKSSK